MYGIILAIVIQESINPINVALTALAVVVAGISVVVTFRQGRAIQKIESKEHEWESADRSSAHLQVTRISDTQPRPHGRRGEPASYTREDWIRLTNTGRVPARNVSWKVDPAAQNALARGEGSLSLLHPGEHFDIYLILSMGIPSEADFEVSWTDDLGDHTTTRLMNL
jgi:hypothetical protein